MSLIRHGEQAAKKQALPDLKLPAEVTAVNDALPIKNATVLQTNETRKRQTRKKKKEKLCRKIVDNRASNGCSFKAFGNKNAGKSLLELSCKVNDAQKSKALELGNERLMFERNRMMRQKKKLPHKLLPLDYWQHKRSVLSSSATQRGLKITNINDTMIMRFRWSNYDKKDINTVLLDTV